LRLVRYSRSRFPAGENMTEVSEAARSFACAELKAMPGRCEQCADGPCAECRVRTVRKVLRTGAANFSASGLKRQDNDLVVIKIVWGNVWGNRLINSLPLPINRPRIFRLEQSLRLHGEPTPVNLTVPSMKNAEYVYTSPSSLDQRGCVFCARMLPFLLPIEHRV
jgi:hypothetical protein